jgi:hypothetical protein
MPRQTPEWKKQIPEFLGAIACATKECDIQKACEDIKKAVMSCYPDTPASRRNPMSEIRKEIKEKYQTQENKSELDAVFPYFFTNSGKGNVPRLEHLAIKYLNEEWNAKSNWSDTSEKKDSESVEVANNSANILDRVELTPEELQFIQEAIGDEDVNGWVKKALIQQAKIEKALKERKTEDLSTIPSETLMTDNKYRTSPQACRELTNRAVRAIKAFNTKSPEYRWCITNKLISELTGNTVKAIAKAVEGMDIDSYNQSMELQPVDNRLTKATIGDVKKNVSIKDILGINE